MIEYDPLKLIELEQRLGVAFRDRSHLGHALVHRSLLRDLNVEGQQSNERLEFLGDAIIGALVARFLYDELPDASEGELTLLRTQLVRASTLAEWARELELERYLRLGRSDEAGHRRSRLLARTFEAVVGAIYLDQGVRSVARFLRPYLRREFNRLRSGQPILDAKSRLQQVTQKRFDLAPTYRVLEVTGPAHDPTFNVELTIGEHFATTAVGGTKQGAEQSAAEQALKALVGQVEGKSTLGEEAASHHED